MKKVKKILALSLAAALCSTALTACGGGNSSSSSGTSGSSSSSSANAKPEKVVFSLISFNNIPEDTSDISDTINKYIKEKYPDLNVEVDLQVYGPADYAQKVNLALQSGTQMDMFVTLNTLSTFVSKNQCYPLDDLISKYGKETTAMLEKDFGPEALQATTLNGKIYAIPTNKGMSTPPTLVYDVDLLKQTGYTADDINTIDDLDKVFEASLKKNPSIIPFAPLSQGETNIGLLTVCTNEIDVLTDANKAGVVIGDSGKVVNFYDSDPFKENIAIVRDWYNKGYLQKDAATSTTTSQELFTAGRLLCSMGGYSGNEVGKTMSMLTGRTMETKRIAPAYFDTSSLNSVSWCISSTSQVPEAAMKYLNLVYSDEFVINTMLYGIEGTDYVKVDEHHMKYPDGKDASTVHYTAAISTGVMGSESLQLQSEGINWSDVELKLKENKETKRSPYFGFSFDQSEVKTEMSAISNVVKQYLPGLVCGSLDPETALPQFNKALEDAGLNGVIQQKQEQLDKWLAAKK